MFGCRRIDAAEGDREVMPFFKNRTPGLVHRDDEIGQCKDSIRSGSARCSAGMSPCALDPRIPITQATAHAMNDPESFGSVVEDRPLFDVQLDEAGGCKPRTA